MDKFFAFASAHQELTVILVFLIMAGLVDSLRAIFGRKDTDDE